MKHRELTWESTEEPKVRFSVRPNSYDTHELNGLEKQAKKVLSSEGGETTVVWEDTDVYLTAQVYTNDLEAALAVIRSNPLRAQFSDGMGLAVFTVYKGQLRFVEATNV